jgi:hypothetical protein
MRTTAVAGTGRKEQYGMTDDEEDERGSHEDRESGTGRSGGVSVRWWCESAAGVPIPACQPQPIPSSGLGRIFIPLKLAS